MSEFALALLIICSFIIMKITDIQIERLDHRITVLEHRKSH